MEALERASMNQRPMHRCPREINTAELGQTLEAMFRYVDGWCTQIEVAVDESH